MLCRVLILCLLVAHTAWSTDEVVVWERAQILDAEQIAKSGRVDVPIPIVKLAIPVNFNNFRYPFLQPDKSVVFLANDRAGGGREGVYRIAANGELSILAGEYDEFDNAPFMITGFSGLRVAGGRAVFRCGFANGMGDSGVGIGMWENGNITLFARTGDALGFEDIGYPGLSSDIVTFLAHRNGEVGELYAVDLASIPRLPRKVADTSTAIPGHSGKFFGSFGFQQDADGESAIFRGFDVGARELLQQTGDRAAALGGVYRKNIRSSDPPEKIIDTGTLLPGAPSGTTFAELRNALPRDGTVVVPSWSPNHSGIYFIDRDGKTRLVADTATRIPDLFDGPFTGFDKWAANCAPYVIFRGQARGYEGLFAMDTDRNELYLLLDRRETFDGKAIAGLEFGNNARIDEDLVLAIEFSDGSSGIYLLKFGDGLGKAVFRRDVMKAARGESAQDERGDFNVAVDARATGGDAARGGAISAEILAEGSFRLKDKACFYVNLPQLKQASLNQGVAFLLPPDSSCAREGKAVLVERGLVLPAGNDLGFGFRCALFAEGEQGCSVDGYDIFVEHPGFLGSDGQMQTSTTVPMKPCFKNGRAEDYVIHIPNDERGTIPGRWTVQIRKDGEALLSRSFTLL